MIEIVIGWLIRLFHIMGASLFMILVVFHWVSGIWLSLKIIEQNGLNKKLQYCGLVLIDFMWFSGLLMLIVLLLCSFMGYICIWGQMSYWGITVMINILSIMPFIGFYIGEYLWCSFYVLVNSVFMVHFCLGFSIGVLIMVHLMILHSYSSSNPFINNISYCFSFIVLFFKDMFVCWLVIGLLITFFLTVDPDLLGNPDNLVKANPLSTPNHILPEWYFNGFYCILRSFPNKTMGVCMVMILFMLIALF